MTAPPSDRNRVLHGDEALVADAVRQLDTQGLGLPPRINSDPDSAERGLAHLVLTVVEILRQLMERQAVRRMEGGGLSDEQIDRLGSTLLALEDRMQELIEHFGLRQDDLRLPVGTVHDLM